MIGVRSRKSQFGMIGARSRKSQFGMIGTGHSLDRRHDRSRFFHIVGATPLQFLQHNKPSLLKSGLFLSIWQRPAP